jgi:ABC-type amino acid transport substrate-binding protein
MQCPIVTIVAAVTAMLLTLVLPATADRLDEVKARGKIIVGVSDTTPPFTFKRPGESEHVGYDIDLVRAVAKRWASAWRRFHSRAPSASRCYSRASSTSSRPR